MMLLLLLCGFLSLPPPPLGLQRIPRLYFRKVMIIVLVQTFMSAFWRLGFGETVSHGVRCCNPFVGRSILQIAIYSVPFSQKSVIAGVPAIICLGTCKKLLSRQRRLFIRWPLSCYNYETETRSFSWVCICVCVCVLSSQCVRVRVCVVFLKTKQAF